MVERLLKASGVEVSEVESSSMPAIPINEARFCINCEHIVRNSACPVCGSKSHMLLASILGLMKSNGNVNEEFPNSQKPIPLLPAQKENRKRKSFQGGKNS